MSDRTKFTIVIPTRERARYLESSLRTCVTQDYDNFEVIVSDNFSQDGTKEVVSSFRDDRIRYLNTGRRLGMSQNWEFALSHVEQGYVTFIGDDDGLLPGALREVDEIVRATRCQAINGRLASFFWPDFPIPEMRGIVRVALRRSVRKVRSCDTIKNVLSFRERYGKLPMLYYGFVDVALINRAKREAHRFFHSMNPDIYSGFVIAFMTDHYYWSTRPYAIAGASGAANSGAFSARGTEFENAATEKVARQFLEEDNLPFHPWLVFCPSNPILVAEAFLQARDHISAARQFDIDLRLVMQAAARRAEGAPSVKYTSAMEAIREIGRRNNLEAYASHLISAARNRPRPVPRPVIGYLPVNKTLTLDCAEFGVSNVYQASLLCRHAVALKEKGYYSLLGYLRTGFETARLIRKRPRRLVDWMLRKLSFGKLRG